MIIGKTNKNMTSIIPSRKPTIPAPPAVQTSSNRVQFGNIEQPKGQRVLIYGTGGIGKTTLACMIPGNAAFFDVDESLPVLKNQLVAQGIALPVPVQSPDWQTIRRQLQSSGWDDIKN